MRILVTGGAGFIGSALVRRLITEPGVERIVTVDRLTYAGSLASIEGALRDARHVFAEVDIADRAAVRGLFEAHRPDAVLHLAAESHVDRSIDAPAVFLDTNVSGTFTLLEEARRHRDGLAGGAADAFRFVHVSTDEVYGALPLDERRFDESSRYRPTSPYSATKAAADHLARAWWHTYELPVVVTNCSNNYGPYQFPEKLIPLMILKGLAGERLPVYGRGENVRDWIHVDDHVAGLLAALRGGRPGETYLLGGDAERRNIDVVRAICATLDELAADPTIADRTSLIEFVTDRPAHDLRYAIDASKAKAELGWAPARDFETGLRETVAWYLENGGWVERIRRRGYAGERLGLGARPVPDGPA
ncbi:MAG: dTDP-glucose 4,6-dehydratase [Longimicrobiales bacterium]